MMSPAPESDDPPRDEAAPDWEAVTAFIQWDQALPAGTRLRDYEIRSVIGESSFGIVYLAWDHSLRRRVALKEYLPRSLAARARDTMAIAPKPGISEGAFATGLKAFIAEARMLARFDHPALLKVYRFWEEHGTAYMVMPHCEGPSLESALAKAERPQNEAEVRAWLRPVLDGIGVMHAARCYHQHIGPDNIVLTPNGPVLLDCAAARRLVDGLAMGPTAVVKPGYAPIEQYSEAATLAPGPWTDLYSLAAVVYRAVGGHAPVPASERFAQDGLVPLARLAADRGTEGFLQAIDATLAVQPEHRPRNDAEFRELLGGIEAPLPAIPIASQRDLMAEPFAPGDDAAREVTVPIRTQPYPVPEVEADDPMARPFMTQPAEVAARPPFAREEIGLSRKVMIGLAAGVCGLGAVAAFVLYFYAGRPAQPMATEATSAASAVVGVASTVVGVAPPAAIRPVAVKPPPVTLKPQPVALPVLPATPVLVERDGARAATESVRRIPVEKAPTDEADRRTRCGDLLLEATLRRLTTAEAAFFKKECR